MASKMKRNKKQRAHKVSKGIHGAGGKRDHIYSEVEKVLLGGGMLRNVKDRWRTPAKVTEAAE